MRISDWSSDVCSSDLPTALSGPPGAQGAGRIGKPIQTIFQGADFPASEAERALELIPHAAAEQPRRPDQALRQIAVDRIHLVREVADIGDYRDRKTVV